MVFGRVLGDGMLVVRKLEAVQVRPAGGCTTNCCPFSMLPLIWACLQHKGGGAGAPGVRGLLFSIV